jgi:hypothetical protein
MRAAKTGRIAISLTVALFLAAAPGLRAQQSAATKSESFGEGRIIRADGTKIRVFSFVIDPGIDRVVYSGDRLRGVTDPEPSSLALNMVRSIQARQKPTFASVAQTFLMGAFAGGIVSLLASNPWGGPWKDTWPAIGLGTAVCGAAGAVIGLTVPRYRTVYTNPEAMPKPIIKLTMGPVAPRTPGLSLSIAY